MLDLIIKGGNVINAEHSECIDIAIKDEKIVALGDSRHFGEANETIDAANMYVFPGMIDNHAHIATKLGEFSTLDSYNSSTIAAACGGTTTIIDFAFLNKGETPSGALTRKLNEAKGNCVIDYSFHPCINSADTQSYEDIRCLLQDGFRSIKIFTINRGALMLEKSGIYEVLKIIAREGGSSLIHAECDDMIQQYIADAVAAGKTLPVDHKNSRPVITELEAMYAILAMVRDTGTPVIFAHMTTSQSRQMLREAKKDAPIFVESCPHYLTLTEEKYAQEDGYLFVCSPPFRTAEDRDGLWEMINEGLIDIISSDHNDFTIEQKTKYKDFFPKAPNGLPGIETCGTVLFSEGVAKERISVNRFVELTSASAAKLLGIYPQKGAIMVGSDADIVVFDPAVKHRYSGKGHHMSTDYSPFEGIDITGKVRDTIVRGHIVVRQGKYTDAKFRGSLLKLGTPVL